MAYTPTGKPRGRPKTSDTLTVMARLPRDLAETVKHYAEVHRQSVSELIRDGLEMRLEAGDVPGRSVRHTGHGDTAPLSENGETGRQELSPMVYAAVQAAVRETLHAVLTLSSGEHGERVIQQSIPVLQQDTGESQPAAEALEPESARLKTPLDQRPVQAESSQPDTTADDPVSLHGAGFDHEKFYLGRLCPKGHRYGDSGLSLLRRRNNYCQQCDVERKRAARRQAAQAQEGSDAGDFRRKNTAASGHTLPSISHR